MHPQAEGKAENNYNSTLAKFQNNEGMYSNQTMPESDGLYVLSDIKYQGGTGGVDIENIPHSFAPMLKNVREIETAYITEYRYNTRQKGHIYESNGMPVMPEDYVNADGSTPWKIFSNNWQVSGGQVQDAPFFFSKATGNKGTCDYEDELRQWMNIDHQHLRRVTGRQQMLVWLTNDPMTKIGFLGDAQLQKMAYWTGKNGRWDINSFDEADGIGEGREAAWMIDCVAHAAVFSGEL